MNTRGFTLIELLVVISIIGMLASIVLASLEDARLKARDTAIRAEVSQLRTVMELEASASGKYTAIKAGGAWKTEGDDCSTSPFSGPYASQARAICAGIMQNIGNAGCNTNCLYFVATNPDSPQTFSILAYLPGESKEVGDFRWFCMGSSGRISISPAGWSLPGCWSNP